MKYRNLRIAWSMVWGVVAVLLCVLWVRSYTRQETISRSGRGASSVSTLRGSFFVNEGFNLTTDAPGKIAIPSTIYYERTPLAGGRIYISSQLDYGYVPRGKGTRFPIWLAVAATALIAVVPWLHWPTRFSLRTLLIVTTLVALGWGAVMWAVR